MQQPDGKPLGVCRVVIEVPPSDFVAWAKEAGLYLALPAVFKG